MLIRNHVRGLQNGVAFAPANEGGSGGDAAAAAAAAAAADPGAKKPDIGADAAGGKRAGGQPADGKVPSTYRPEGLPDHLAGASDNETIDKLFKAMDGFRRTEGERGAVPKTPEQYQVDFGDKVKPYTANFAKDPVWQNTLKIAHAAEITDKQFNKFMPKLLESLVDGGLVAAPVDANAQMLSLVPAEAAGLDDTGKKAAVEARMRNNIAWVDGALQQQTIPKEVADFFTKTLPDDPGAHHVIEWLRGNDAEVRPALGGDKGGGATDEALHARLDDPRGDPNSDKFDRAFAEETDRRYQQRYGS